MKTKIKIKWEEVKELIPKRVSLYYVDYSDSLDESMEIIQNCIHEGNMDSIHEKVDEWYVDGADTAHYCVIKDARDKANVKYFSALRSRFEKAEDIINNYINQK